MCIFFKLIYTLPLTWTIPWLVFLYLGNIKLYLCLIILLMIYIYLCLYGCLMSVCCYYYYLTAQRIDSYNRYSWASLETSLGVYLFFMRANYNESVCIYVMCACVCVRTWVCICVYSMLCVGVCGCVCVVCVGCVWVWV